MKKINLTKGQHAIVDDADYEMLKAKHWHAMEGGGNCKTYYAACCEKGTNRRLLMHRMIMNPNPEQCVDHIDGNTLNNQRSNLRVCTHAQNLRNRRKQRNNTSGYVGVRREKRSRNKWYAKICFNGTHKHLGTFNSAKEASIAYLKAAKQLYGEFMFKSKAGEI